MTIEIEAPEGAGSASSLASEPQRVTLEPRLDLRAAATLVEALTEARGHDLAIEGREVRHLGAAALQVLIAARRSWAESGRALTLEAPSEALLEGLQRLGASINAITVEAGP